MYIVQGFPINCLPDVDLYCSPSTDSQFYCKNLIPSDQQSLNNSLDYDY